MRRCQKCKDLKLLNEFFARKKERGLKSPYCKPCFVKINTDYKKNNPDGVKATKKKEYEKNRRRYLDTDYKRKYGISLEDFEEKDSTWQSTILEQTFPVGVAGFDRTSYFGDFNGQYNVGATLTIVPCIGRQHSR